MTAATVPLLRTSERNDFKRCPWLWQESWVKGYTTRRTPTWAWFGTAIHRGLEERYQIGNRRGSVQKMLDAFVDSTEEQVRRIYTEGGEVEDDEVVDGRELGIAMLKGYVDFYGKDSEWEVIHREQSFQIDVPGKKGRTVCVYAGTWDLLARNRITKEFWIWDHKTRRSFPSNWGFYNINDQAGSYLWVAPEVLRHLGVFKKKDTIEGLVFNTLRKHMPDARPVGPTGERHNKPQKQHYIDALEAKSIGYPTKATVATLAEVAQQHRVEVFGEVSAVQPSPLYHREEIYRSEAERVQMANRVKAEAQWMDAIRSGKMPVFKTPTEDCNRCQLFEYCEADEQNYEEGQELARSLLRHRDPYLAHREAMERGGVVL